MPPDFQGAGREEQERTTRVDGMASFERIVADGYTGMTGYQKGHIVGGHYEIVDFIGAGGMSRVYKVRHLLINEPRAIKVLLPQDSTEQAKALLRFQKEARLAMKLEHANIVRTMEFCSPSDGPPFLVMDYVEGRSLEQELSVLQRLTPERAVEIILQVASAVQHLLEKEILHRDLKPGNVILNRLKNGATQVKLIDFGIATALYEEDEDFPLSQVLTPAGEVMGSPQHMSPEACGGENIDERSEIYSLGCILYEMLAGKPPILGKNALDTLRMQASVEPRPISKLLPKGEGIEQLSQIVSKCLEKEPDQRYQSIDELKEALGTVFEKAKKKQQARLQNKASKLTKIVFLAAGIALGGAVVYGATLLFNQSRQDKAPEFGSANEIKNGPGLVYEYGIQWRRNSLKGQTMLNDANLEAMKDLKAALKVLPKSKSQKDETPDFEDDRSTESSSIESKAEQEIKDLNILAKQDLYCAQLINDFKSSKVKEDSLDLDKIELTDNTRSDKLSHSLLKKITQEKSLGNEIFSRIKLMLLCDGDYTNFNLQKQIARSALDKPNSDLSESQKLLLKSLWLLRFSQYVEKVQGKAERPGDFFWNEFGEGASEKESTNFDENTALAYFLAGEYYFNIGDNWDAKHIYKLSKDALTRLNGEDALITVMARSQLFLAVSKDEEPNQREGNRCLKKLKKWLDREPDNSRLLYLDAMVRATLARKEKGIEKEIALSEIDYDLTKMQLTARRSPYLLARLLHEREAVLRQIYGDKKNNLVNFRAATLQLVQGNLPQAADRLEDLAKYYSSPSTAISRHKLLQLALSIEERLKALGLERNERACETHTYMAETLLFQEDKQLAQKALQELDLAEKEAQTIDSRPWDKGEEKIRTQALNAFRRAQIWQGRAKAQKNLLLPREALASIKSGLAELDKNIKYLEKTVKKEKKTLAVYISDMKERSDLYAELKQIETGIKNQIDNLNQIDKK
ncbi:MAG: protein kinase [Candidatus Obscuribacterales bacterium]|nr:protein kinase [Candidatus Obscuribacterales bacterium]